LTGWRIDIRSDVSVAEARAAATETARAARAAASGASVVKPAEIDTTRPADSAKPKRATGQAGSTPPESEPAAEPAPVAAAAAVPVVKPKRVTRKAPTPSEGVAS
jgi:hypothetical protein